MFTVQARPNGRHAPVIACDHCGGPIQQSGTVEWLLNHAERIVADGPWTLHKRCSTPFRARQRGGEAALPPGLVWQWWELDAFLAALVHNGRVDLAEGAWRNDLLGPAV